MINIESVQKILSGENINGADLQEGFMKRFWKVYHGLIHQKNKEEDLLVLLRQSLRAIDLHAGSQSRTVLKVEKTLFTKAGLKKFGIDTHESDDHYTVSAKPWLPNWLTGGRGYDPTADAISYKRRRDYEKIPADPFVTKYTGFTEYNNSAQRDAIRAMMTMPKGATLLSCLPTGSGKSLCAWLSALMEPGLTIVVVPTIALAMDQEKALQEWISRDMAFYGGEDSQERRRNIKEAIQQDDQPVIITSPESLCTSLYDVILGAAKRKKLSHFIIDEAHLVHEWGDDFRPDYQKLSGIWRSLLRNSEDSIKTVLLSATLTQAAIETLKVLFSKNQFKVFSSLQLRPEPSYWFSQCTKAQKEEKIIEAIRRVPRPLIVYTSEVKDASYWADVIREEDFTRSAVLTGRTKTSERNEVVEKWKNGDLDIVVGTSAFGLGIDQAEVRTVIHACIPENVDRFYQEVGRGGRDGNASLSIVIYTNEDIATAKKLSRKRILTSENGWKRWEKLFEHNERLGTDLYRLDLSLRSDIDIEVGGHNRDWNLKNLLLMAKAGLIELEEERNDKPFLAENEDENQLNWKKYIEKQLNSQVIRIIEHRHLNETHWKCEVDKIRNAIKKDAILGSETMLQLLEMKECISKTLKNFYNHRDIAVVGACGGCPYCRKHHLPIVPGFLPDVSFQWNSYDFYVKGDLKADFFKGVNHTLPQRLWIFDDEINFQNRNWKRRFSNLVRWLAERGIIAFISNADEKVKESLLGTNNLTLLYFHNEICKVPAIPQMHIIRSSEKDALDSLIRYPVLSLPTIVFLTKGMSVPNAPHRKIWDMISSPDYKLDVNEMINRYHIY